MPPQRPGRDDSQKSAVVQTLESKIDLIVQELKNIKKNEEVIGRTLVAQNERLKKLEEKGGGGGSAGSDELRELRKTLGDKADQKDLLEVKSVIDVINPLEFARLDDVKEFIRDEVKKQLSEKK